MKKRKEIISLTRLPTITLKVCEKKCLYRNYKMLANRYYKMLANRYYKMLANRNYKMLANRHNQKAKKAIVIPRLDQYKDLYDKLDNRNGGRDLYRIVKSRHQRARYIDRPTRILRPDFKERISSPIISASAAIFRRFPSVNTTEIEEIIKQL